MNYCHKQIKILIYTWQAQIYIFTKKTNKDKFITIPVTLQLLDTHFTK